MPDLDEQPEKDKRRTKAQLLAVRTPCVFCGERLLPIDKKTHNCWTKKA